MPDQSGNGRHATQSTAANQPILVPGAQTTPQISTYAMVFNPSGTCGVNTLTFSSGVTLTAVRGGAKTVSENSHLCGVPQSLLRRSLILPSSMPANGPDDERRLTAPRRFLAPLSPQASVQFNLLAPYSCDTFHTVFGVYNQDNSFRLNGQSVQGAGNYADWLAAAGAQWQLNGVAGQTLLAGTSVSGSPATLKYWNHVAG